MSNDEAHFIGPLRKSNKVVLGVKGYLRAHCLLCPQQWSQQANDHTPEPHGTVSWTRDDGLLLMWDQRKYHRLIPWSANSNVAKMRSAPGSNKYRTFAAAVEEQTDIETIEHVAYQAHIIPPDDESIANDDEAAIDTDVFRSPSETRPSETQDARNTTDEDAPVGTHQYHIK